MEGLRIKRWSATATATASSVVGIAHKRHRKGGPKKKGTKKPNKQQLQMVDAAGSKEKGGPMEVSDCIKCNLGINHTRHRKVGPKKEKRTKKKPNKQQLQVADAAGSMEEGGERKKKKTTTSSFSPMAFLLAMELEGYMLSEPEYPFMKPDFGGMLDDPQSVRFFKSDSESKADVLLQYRLNGHADLEWEKKKKEEEEEEVEFTQVEENMC